MPLIIAAAQVYYPRSFLKFILLGFLLVSLPLLYALGELILSLDQLQTQGREAVQRAARRLRSRPAGIPEHGGAARIAPARRRAPRDARSLDRE